MAGIGHQLRKGIDRVGFEADKLMRANRVRGEAHRLQGEADERTFALGQKVLEMAGSGAPLDAELQRIASEVFALHAEAEKKSQEVEAINAEVWVEPPPPIVSTPAPEPAQLIAPAEQPSTRATPPTTPRTKSSKQATPKAQPQEVMLNCPNCHAQVRQAAAFCPSCGLKLK